MSNRNYAAIWDKVYNTPWLIEEDSLSLIISILDRKMHGIELTEEELASIMPREQENEDSVPQQLTEPGIGVLNISGPIFPKANLLTAMSGAASVEQMSANFEQMMNDDMVKGIMLNIDSPGGTSDLIAEFGDQIFSARGVKPVWAFANTKACSAAYWLGSQAEKFYTTKSGHVGSVGVYTVHQDLSGAQEKAGINTTIISAGPHKVEGNPYEPLSSSAKDHLQERVNKTYQDFIDVVARGRGIETETVVENYGGGRTLDSEDALNAGMIDGVLSYREAVGNLMSHSLNSGNDGFYMMPISSAVEFTNTTNTKMNEEGRDMPEFSPEFLEALGLSEEATIEDVQEAVLDLASTIAPINEAARAQQQFAEMFPEQARQLQELRERDANNSAKLFAESFERFTNGKGFSSAALEMIEESHKLIASGAFKMDDFSAFLNYISEGNAIVDYREIGTSREQELVTAGNKNEAARQIATLATAKQAEAGGASELSWGDAIAMVTNEHPDLARLYAEGGE